MSTNENTATEKRDAYATVTDQIIKAIEQGVSNWRMPWHTSGKYAFLCDRATCPYRKIHPTLKSVSFSKVTRGTSLKIINRHIRKRAGRHRVAAIRHGYTLLRV
jgi:antirestriction factor ArdC-like protein